MQNNISIDDFVKQRLDNGGEQLNLGAWANMNRMLDGENPYAPPEEDKKRRPFFFIFTIGLLLSGLIATGVYKFFHKSENKSAIAKAKPANNTNNNYQNNTTNTSTVNKVAENNSTNTKSASANIAINNKPNTNQNQQALTAINKTNSTNKLTPKNENNNTQYQNNNTEKENTFYAKNQNATKTIAKNIANDNVEEASATIKTNNSNNISTENTNNIAINNTEKIKGNANDKSISLLKKVKNIFTKNKINKTQPKQENASSNISKLANNNATTIDAVEETTSNETIFKKNKSTTKNKKESEVQNDSITQIFVTTKTKKNKNNGNIETIQDTTAIAKEALPVKTENTQQALAQTDGKINPAKYNPRLVANSKNYVEKRIEILPKPNTNLANNTEVIAPIVNTITKVKNPNTDYNKAVGNYFERMVENIKKVRYMKLFNMNIPVNPGIFMGVNASLFNTEHDFGGFQMGTNLMMQLSKNLSLIPHLGLSYKNNSAYSIRDKEVLVSNQAMPIAINATQNVYSAKIDSTVNIYNFKHLISLEMPILMEYSISRWGFYAGPNFAYGFKLKTNNIVHKYSTTLNDTVSNTSLYNYPSNQYTFFKSPDFNGRFGIGYVAGFNLQWTPNMYLDCRISKNTWTNANTASSAEMSKKMFTVPSIQLNLLYRFKEKRR